MIAPDSTDYRAVVLARTADRIVLAGGRIVRLSPTCTCAREVNGRAVELTLDAQGVVTALRLAPNDGTRLRPASDIPLAAFAFPTQSSTSGDPSTPVTFEIVVTVPAQTPPTDDVYVTTERSGWNPAELRMNRIDALHWGLSLTLPRGAHVAYRFTRGSFASTERNDARQLPEQRAVVAQAGVKTTDRVASWADIY